MIQTELALNTFIVQGGEPNIYIYIYIPERKYPKSFIPFQDGS